MKTQIVSTDPKNPILIIASNDNLGMSFNFEGKRQDFYALHLQLTKLFETESAENEEDE